MARKGEVSGVAGAVISGFSPPSPPRARLSESPLTLGGHRYPTVGYLPFACKAVFLSLLGQRNPHPVCQGHFEEFTGCEGRPDHSLCEHEV